MPSQSSQSPEQLLLRPAKQPPTREFKESFPRRIWQTSEKGFYRSNAEDKALMQTWLDLNSIWRYESMTQDTAVSYVEKAYADEPDILTLFTSLSDPILRADLIRYLILLKEGGVYSDSDTKALKPIETWIPPDYKTIANVVIGVEYDARGGVRWADWTLDLQFTTWTILAKPAHPLLRTTVDNAISGLRALATEQETTTSNLTMTFSQVLDTTGPAMFSRTVYAYLSSRLGKNFTWKDVTSLSVPWLVDDILILPVTAFGCGQKHSGAGKPSDPGAFVQHMFRGSWKGKHSLQEEYRKKKLEAEEMGPVTSTKVKVPHESVF